MARPRAGGSFDVMLLRHPPGSASGTVVERRPLAAEAVDGWVTSSRAGTRIFVLPAAATICRAFRLPGNLPPEQTRQVLLLQAEGHLLGGVPIHRTAVGVLPRRQADGATGLLLAWSEKSIVPTPPGREWRVVPEPLALLAAAPRDASAALLVVADEDDGSIAVHLAEGERMLLRSTCETPDAEGDWTHTLRRVVAETALAAGLDAAEARRIADDSSARAVRGDGLVAVGLDQDLPEFAGVPASDPLGRLLAAAAAAARGELRDLASIVPNAPVAERSWLQRVVDGSLAAVSTPLGATRVAVVALLVAAFLPIAAAGARVAILRGKLPDPDGFEQAMRESEQQLAVYRELETQAWPMMKMLGDLSNCMPESIEVESIVVGHGEPITIKGTAKPEGQQSGADAILEMERRMRASQVFDKITKRWDPPDARGVYEFSISADVARPTSRPRFPEAEDFAAMSLAERRYGPSARPGGAAREQPSTPVVESPADLPPGGTSEPSSAVAVAGVEPTEPTSAPEAAEAPLASASSESSGAAGPERGIGRRRGEPSPSGGGRAVEVPQWSETVSAVTFTDDEIEAMSKAEAQAALGRVSRARQSPGLDDDAKARLKELFERILRRVREAP